MEEEEQTRKVSRRMNIEYACVVDVYGAEGTAGAVRAPTTSLYLMDYNLKLRNRHRSDVGVAIRVMVDGRCRGQRRIELCPGKSLAMIDGKVYCKRGEKLWFETDDDGVAIIAIRGGIKAIRY
jgi:hypothetical protein